MIVQRSPRAVMTAVFKQIWRFIFIFVAVNLLAIAYLLIATPEFESTAQLLFRFGQDRRPAISKQDAATPDVSADERAKIIQSNIDIMKSRDMAESLLNSLKIEHVYPGLIENPPDQGTVMDAAVIKLSRKLTIKMSPSGDVMEIAVDHPDAIVSTEMANRLVSLFLQHQAKIYTNPQADFLAGQVKDSEKQLNKSRLALNTYMSQAGLAAVDDELTALVRRRSDIAELVAQHTANRADADARVANLRESMKNVPKNEPISVESERFKPLDDAQERLRDLRFREQQALRTFSPESQAVRDLEKDIAFATRDAAAKEAELAKRIKQTPSQVYEGVESSYLQQIAVLDAESAQTQVFTKELADIDKQLGDLRTRKNRYDDLQRQVDVDMDNYKMLAQHYDEARVADNMNLGEITNVEVIEHPVVPFEPAKPRKLLVLALGFCASIALGLAACLMREKVDERISLPEQVAVLSRLPVLAVFPDMGRKNRPSTI
ncbi:MAG TPA: GNVR domain-containing protein [Aliidongia sp.]|nr:GNVR domain-containing protein [Aliidongia sp.]